jgi:spore germination protein
MESEGSALEYIWPKVLLEQSLLDELQKDIEKTIEDRSKKVVEKFQKEFKVDLIGISSYLRQNHPEIFKSIEKDYENFFANNIIINIKAKVAIRRVGTLE